MISSRPSRKKSSSQYRQSRRHYPTRKNLNTSSGQTKVPPKKPKTQLPGSFPIITSCFARCLLVRGLPDALSGDPEDAVISCALFYPSLILQVPRYG